MVFYDPVVTNAINEWKKKTTTKKKKKTDFIKEYLCKTLVTDNLVNCQFSSDRFVSMLCCQMERFSPFPYFPYSHAHRRSLLEPRKLNVPMITTAQSSGSVRRVCVCLQSRWYCGHGVPFQPQHKRTLFQHMCRVQYKTVKLYNMCRNLINLRKSTVFPYVCVHRNMYLVRNTAKKPEKAKFDVFGSKTSNFGFSDFLTVFFYLNTSSCDVRNKVDI